MNAHARRVAVLGGIRIPFARQDGPYATASNQDMLTATLDALATKFDLQGEVMGEVAAGAVLKHSRDFNLTRESVLGSKLAPETPAYDVQQACGTGLETTILVANKIALGQIECGIAAGSDTTSDAPLALNEDLREVLLEAKRAKTNGGRLRALAKLRPQQIVPEIPRNAEPRTGLSMGEHTALMAREWGIARQDQDELAVRSHHHLAAAYDDGFLDDLVTPFLGLERDQNLRPDSSVEKLAKLRPVFGGPDGTMTAGNSTPLSDGASAVLLASEEWAAEHEIRRAGVLHRGADGRRRLRRQAGGSADGARLRDADDARAGRAHARRLRLLRDPRGVRRPGAVHAEGLGGPGVLPRAARARCAARRDRYANVSTSTAARSGPGTRSAPPAGESLPDSPRCSPRKAPAAA